MEDAYHGKAVDYIHSYSIKDNKWKLLDAKLPVPLKHPTCICSKDERYIITFGGNVNPPYINTDNIFIIDTESLEIKKSSLKCPSSDCFRACLVDDTQRSDLIVSGFINQYWNEDG